MGDFLHSQRVLQVPGRSRSNAILVVRQPLASQKSKDEENEFARNPLDGRQLVRWAERDDHIRANITQYWMFLLRAIHRM